MLPRIRTATLVIAFFVSNSSLLVLNKVAISAIQNASALLFIQISSTVLFVGLCAHFANTPINCTPSSKVVRAYAAAAVVWCGTIFSNFYVLRAIGVNAFIILRCSTPLFVCVLDWMFLGRTLPNKRSTAALFAILLSGKTYANLKFRDEASFEASGGFVQFWTLVWCMIWLCCFLTDVTFIKYIIGAYPCSAMERTLYQNIFALPVLSVLLLAQLEEARLSDVLTAPESARIALVLSCLAGAVLSFVGMSLRSELSATTFTILGIVCKMGSTCLNELLVEPERDFMRLVCISAVIVSSAIYRQAPLRSEEGHGLE